MQFTEPMTMLTDYALAAITGLLGVRLFRAGDRSGQASVRLWAAAFIAIAVTALVGGTHHGGGHILSERTINGLWKATMFMSGFISFFIFMAAVVACLPRPWQFWILGAAVIKLLLYLPWVSIY